MRTFPSPSCTGRLLARVNWLLLCVLLPQALPALAQPADPFRIEVGVLDQSRAERQQALETGLLLVLTRVTGLKDVPMVPQVRTALADPGRLLRQSLYLAGDNPSIPLTSAAAARLQTPAQPDAQDWRLPQPAPLKLVLQFDAAAVHQLIREAGLPLWSAARPEVLVLLVVDDGLRRRLLHQQQPHQLPYAMAQRAQVRGLNLKQPVTDVVRDADQQVLVSVAQAWNHDWPSLQAAAAQLGLNAVLVGRISPTPTGGWLSDWQFRLGDLEQRFVLEGHDQTLLGRTALDTVADDLFARFAVYPGAQGALRLLVSAVPDLTAYGGLMAYLQGLAFVDQVVVESVYGDQISLVLHTQASAERLLELLALDGRLQAAAGSLQLWQPDLLEMRWQG